MAQPESRKYAYVEDESLSGDEETGHDAVVNDRIKQGIEEIRLETSAAMMPDIEPDEWDIDTYREGKFKAISMSKRGERRKAEAADDQHRIATEERREIPAIEITDAGKKAVSDSDRSEAGLKESEFDMLKDRRKYERIPTFQEGHQGLSGSEVEERRRVPASETPKAGKKALSESGRSESGRSEVDLEEGEEDLMRNRRKYEQMPSIHEERRGLSRTEVEERAIRRQARLRKREVERLQREEEKKKEEERLRREEEERNRRREERRLRKEAEDYAKKAKKKEEERQRIQEEKRLREKDEEREKRRKDRLLKKQKEKLIVEERDHEAQKQRNTAPEERGRADDLNFEAEKLSYREKKYSEIEEEIKSYIKRTKEEDVQSRPVRARSPERRYRPRTKDYHEASRGGAPDGIGVASYRTVIYEPNPDIDIFKP